MVIWKFERRKKLVFLNSLGKFILFDEKRYQTMVRVKFFFFCCVFSASAGYETLGSIYQRTSLYNPAPSAGLFLTANIMQLNADQVTELLYVNDFTFHKFERSSFAD